ncbi:ArsR/SmtB family transcription factor [Desulfurococcus amylolyticus]|uniref:ArsR/SmtB family transcription factor n=1 Tax=Desulfurococcus amylolyticus TaxID=94694 RepID=UPI0005B21D95|nr:HTH domain-containing protein [Desulfurococcus amylolyticus]
MIKERILEFLKEVYPTDLPINEVARRLGISRSTAAKYIAVLKAEGRVECRRVGKAKLCRTRGGA